MSYKIKPIKYLPLDLESSMGQISLQKNEVQDWIMVKGKGWRIFSPKSNLYYHTKLNKVMILGLC